MKIFEWPVLAYSFSTIDCSVIKTIRKTKNEISISNHKYLNNQTGDRLVKVMGFLTDIKVYDYDCSMSLHVFQDIVSESEAMLQSHFKLILIFSPLVPLQITSSSVSGLFWSLRESSFSAASLEGAVTSRFAASRRDSSSATMRKPCGTAPVSRTGSVRLNAPWRTRRRPSTQPKWTTTTEIH